MLGTTRMMNAFVVALLIGAFLADCCARDGAVLRGGVIRLLNPHFPQIQTHTGYGIAIGNAAVMACLSTESREAMLPWASSEHCAPNVRAGCGVHCVARVLT